MKKIILIALSILPIIIFASCGCDRYVSKYDKDYVYDGKSLVGIWQEIDYEDQYYETYEFTKDGKVFLTSYSFGIEMQKIDATYKVDGNNSLVIAWERNGAPETNTNDFSITNDGVLVLRQVVDSKTTEMELTPYNLKYNEKNDIVGSWRNTDKKDEIFTFNKDYTGRAGNNNISYKFYYSLKDSSLFMSIVTIDGFKDVVETMSYKVEGNTLTLSGKNADKSETILTFERVE